MEWKTHSGLRREIAAFGLITDVSWGRPEALGGGRPSRGRPPTPGNNKAVHACLKIEKIKIDFSLDSQICE